MPAGSDILLLVRGQQALPVKQDTILEPDDHVHVMVRPEDKRAIELLFGLREED
jgi:potassium/hydrogen antiporter